MQYRNHHMENWMSDQEYPIHSVWKVRHLKGLYEVIDSQMTGTKRKVRRYKLKAIPNTGCLVDETSAFGADLNTVDQVVLDELKSRRLHLPPFELEEGSFGGELDPYSLGARAEPATPNPGLKETPPAVYSGSGDALAPVPGNGPPASDAPRSEQSTLEDELLKHLVSQMETMIKLIEMYLERRNRGG